MNATRNGRRIVLVDDEEALAWSLASRLMRARPHDRVETAHDGESALGLLSAAPVDLLIADIRMPGMSGIDLVLAARHASADLPVIVMTAFPSADLPRLGDNPFTGFLEKPFEFDHLRDLVERAFARDKVGFSGAISVQTLPDVVQLYVLSSATGALRVRHRHQEGEIYFAQGAILHAMTATTVGDAAFYEIMTWSGGEFSMRIGAVAPERSVASNWQELLMESVRRVDELRRFEEPRIARTGWTLAPPPSLAEDELEAAFSDLEPEAAPSATASGPAVTSSIINRETPVNIKDSLSKLNSIDGFIGAALVDSESGMLLGQEGGQGVLNLEVAAAGNTEVVRAKRKTMTNLALKDQIEDILISLGKQYHIIRPLRGRPTLFFYVAVDRQRANLAMARITLADVEKDLVV